MTPPGPIIEGDQLDIKCTVQVTHLLQKYPEIIIQKDKTIVAASTEKNEAIYSVMAMVENSGHYTCKVESSRISKVSSIVVNITGRDAEEEAWQVVGSRGHCGWAKSRMSVMPAFGRPKQESHELEANLGF